MHSRLLVPLYAILLGGVLLVPTSLVFAQTGSGERIHNFDVEARIRPDATVEVTETIVYDFGPAERHGIFRDIPVRYGTRNGSRSISISGISVVDESGVPYRLEVSSAGKDKQVKIGDPGSYVSGVRTYVIRYVAGRVIGYFDDHDEFYWNATGNGWEAPVERASARVFLPPTEAGAVTVSCYEGSAGSAETCSATAASTVTPIEAGVRADFAASRRLEAGEGLTIAVGFPKGAVRKPTAGEGALQFLMDNGILALPVVVFAVMLGHWYRKGRDPKGRGAIVPQYEAPEGLTPIEMSAVLHQTARTNDLSAEIIFLATKGILTVTRIPATGIFSGGDDYAFTKTGDGENLASFDAKLIQSLFEAKREVKLSDLKEKFHKNIRGIMKAVDESVVSSGYYAVSPGKVMTKYFALTALIVAVIFAVRSSNPAVLAALGSSAIVVGAFAYFMPKVTPKGAEAREHIAGLKDYLQIAEKDRLAFHNAPAKDPKRFEKLLPYAMVLGVERAWAKEFDGIMTEPPSWYADPSGGVFTALVFANSLHGFNTAAASAFTSAPQGGSGAGGGGFSGGGFGGGGGGSW